MNNEATYLGSAMANPISLSNGRGGTVSGYDVIGQSIVDIMTTPKGTRLFNPDYGNRFDEIRFDPNDEVMLGMMRLFAQESIQDWEKRVRYVGLDFDDIAADMVMCNVEVEVLQSNEIKSFVFPYYKKLIY